MKAVAESLTVSGLNPQQLAAFGTASVIVHFHAHKAVTIMLSAIAFCISNLVLPLMYPAKLLCTLLMRDSLLTISCKCAGSSTGSHAVTLYLSFPPRVGFPRAA